MPPESPRPGGQPRGPATGDRSPGSPCDWADPSSGSPLARNGSTAGRFRRTLHGPTTVLSLRQHARVLAAGGCAAAQLKPRAVAQLARVPVSKTGGWGFESLLPCECDPANPPKPADYR